MAAKLTARQADTSRSAIQSTKIINKLNRFVLEDDGGHSISANQINAARILLAKTVPDQKATDVTSGGNEIKTFDFNK
ncbi:MAG: hypothetical protein GY746_14365 [Gammaproteobacteria bacterium]|nr:hypothetical protein [Gammaproteobacteria bacterium]